ncbi:MAG: hypothetical protein E7275_12260 [Pseudobutyrivibrio sp.]|uniref:hypothetical protein n=1 Tax=Pseudobutyrivibrio sp. TaxID=2014367 RepID=UPI0025CE0755|nr:hypothetical protein [Pseudobutyrivibrio sp.]MBE5905039.1 hypothetical protein [Pseudobutyrivibrio sp.]
MKKYLCIIMAITMMFIACGKKEEKQEFGPDIEWTDEKIDEYLGKEVYCSFDSVAPFYEELEDQCFGVSFYGIVDSFDDEAMEKVQEDGTVPESEKIKYMNVVDENDTANRIRVKGNLNDYAIGDYVCIIGANVTMDYYTIRYDNHKPWDFECYTCVARNILRLEKDEYLEYQSVREIVGFMDKIRETKFKVTGYLSKVTDTTYCLYNTEEHVDIYLTIHSNSDLGKYNAKWVTISGNAFWDEGIDYGICNAEVVDSME